MTVKTVLCVLTVLAFAYGKVVMETDNGKVWPGKHEPFYYMATVKSLSSWASDESSKQTNASAILPKKYVYGGADAEVGVFPWIVHLNTVIDMGNMYSIIKCGGSLISDRHVLTAAHCIEDRMKQYHNLKIYLGEYDTGSYPKDCAGGKCVWNRLVHPDKIFVHAHFDSGHNTNNDLALVRLEKRLHFTPSIQPISLLPFDVDTPEFARAGRPLVVAGWGWTNGRGEVPRVLQAAEMQLLSKRECRGLVRPAVTQSSFCLKDIVNNVCSGDSGGPAVMYYRNKYYLAGVASMSPYCGFPGVSRFTNVFRHMKWIKSHMELV